MTGFAAAEAQAGSFKLVWELRSVNHRYLDIGFRLPEDLRALEPELRKRVADGIKRGKVDCTLKLVSMGAPQAGTSIDRVELDHLRDLERGVLEAAPSAAPLSVFELLRWPGVLKDESASAQELVEPALASFGDAVEALQTARQREGERLGVLLTERLDGISELMLAVQEQLLDAAPRHRERLLERLSKLEVEVDPERLEQELALIAQRADVAEEADRLRAHVSEIRDVLNRDEPVGRRLDFLIQELNREANTLASKVQDEELARRAVDLKVLIEQMREQVQNLE
jgi:uncharacterized protein (TIGR00255 family)